MKLIEHPLTRLLENSVESITAALQEQARAFTECQQGDSKVMNPPKGVVHISHGLSANTTLQEGISLVRWGELVVFITQNAASITISSCKGKMVHSSPHSFPSDFLHTTNLGPARLQRCRHILKMIIGVIFKNNFKPIYTAPFCLLQSESRLTLHGKSPERDGNYHCDYLIPFLFAHSPMLVRNVLPCVCPVSFHLPVLLLSHC